MNDRKRAKIKGGSDNNNNKRCPNTCTVSLEPAKFEAVLKIDNFGLCMFVITQIDTMLWIKAGKETRNVVTPLIVRISRDGFKIDLLKWQLKTWWSKIIAGFHVSVKYDQLLQHNEDHEFVCVCMWFSSARFYWNIKDTTYFWIFIHLHIIICTEIFG